MDKNESSSAQPQAGNNFVIHNIYIKDVSFESPSVPEIFTVAWEPKLDFDLAMESRNINDSVWESTLVVTLKVNVDIAEEKRAEHAGKASLTAFIVEVKIAGVFTIAGFNKETTDKILAIETPSILFPYLREIIAGLVVKGGFPSLLLPPMNFNEIYQKHLQDKQQMAANSANSPIKVN